MAVFFWLFFANLPTYFRDHSIKIHNKYFVVTVLVKLIAIVGYVPNRSKLKCKLIRFSKKNHLNREMVDLLGFFHKTNHQKHVCIYYVQRKNLLFLFLRMKSSISLLFFSSVIQYLKSRLDYRSAMRDILQMSALFNVRVKWVYNFKSLRAIKWTVTHKMHINGIE